MCFGRAMRVFVLPTPPSVPLPSSPPLQNKNHHCTGKLHSLQKTTTIRISSPFGCINFHFKSFITLIHFLSSVNADYFINICRIFFGRQIYCCTWPNIHPILGTGRHGSYIVHTTNTLRTCDPTRGNDGPAHTARFGSSQSV